MNGYIYRARIYDFKKLECADIQKVNKFYESNEFPTKTAVSS